MADNTLTLAALWAVKKHLTAKALGQHHLAFAYSDAKRDGNAFKGFTADPIKSARHNGAASAYEDAVQHIHEIIKGIHNK